MEPWLAELHQSEDRLRAVIESWPVAIVEVDLETRVLGWNRAAERIFGWTREELLGRPGTPMVPPSKQGEHEELVARVRGRRVVQRARDRASAQGRHAHGGHDGVVSTANRPEAPGWPPRVYADG